MRFMTHATPSTSAGGNRARKMQRLSESDRNHPEYMGKNNPKSAHRVKTTKRMIIFGITFCSDGLPVD